jgi:hypothetical protein
VVAVPIADFLKEVHHAITIPVSQVHRRADDDHSRGSVMTIEKGIAIQASLPYDNPHIPAIKPEHLTLFPMLAIMFLAIYTLAAIAWIVLFALRRAGVQRLSEMPAASAQE